MVIELRDYSEMSDNIEWIKQYCEKEKFDTFPRVFGAVCGRFEAADLLGVGSIYSAKEIIELLDFIWETYARKREQSND